MAFGPAVKYLAHAQVRAHTHDLTLRKRVCEHLMGKPHGFMLTLYNEHFIFPSPSLVLLDFCHFYFARCITFIRMLL